jgi:DNA repair exonuclease SbcCD ATPase subunit
VKGFRWRTVTDDVTALRREYDRRSGRRDAVVEKTAALEARVESMRESLEDHAEAMPVLMKIAQLWRTRELTEVHGLVTAALKAVFEYPYEFRFREEEKRGQVELTPVVVDDGEEFEPKSSKGGGITDVLSLAFRPVFWSKMGDRRPDPTMVLDEPGHFVNSAEYIRNLGEMIERLSKALGLQFIIVTNRPAMTHRASRVFDVTKVGRVSKVEVLSGGVTRDHNI